MGVVGIYYISWEPEERKLHWRKGYTRDVCGEGSAAVESSSRTGSLTFVIDLDL